MNVSKRYELVIPRGKYYHVDLWFV